MALDGPPASIRRRLRRGNELRRPSSTATLPNGDAFTLHLLRRATYGVTPELRRDVLRQGGPQGWLEDQLHPQQIPDDECERAVRRFPLRAAPPPTLYRDLEHFAWGAMEDLARATLARAVWSRRQLYEVMVEFWTNHLHITCPSGEVWATKPWDDSAVVRANALGRFENMLLASGTSPAMLLYLDNAHSKGASPNENYGRELLELHTVGQDAGYTQDDVLNCARALTGLSVWDPHNGGTAANYGTFRYRPEWRYVGPLRVLDWSHENNDPGDGVSVATSLYRYLAHHPRTAHRIARKLVVRFVSDAPPQTLVTRLAATYLAEGTAIVPVLRELFASSEFAASIGQKHRRPLEDVVAALRAVGARPSSDTQTEHFGGYVWLLREMGHAPMSWPAPDGYPDTAPAWAGAGSVLARWNVHVGVTAGYWNKGIDYPGELAERLLPGGPPSTRHELVAALHERLVPGLPLPPNQVDHLVTFLGGPGRLQDGDTSWLLFVLVALIMDSPAWSTR